MPDRSGFGFEADDELNNRVTEALLDFMGTAGFDRTFGRRLVGILDRAGLACVQDAGRSAVVNSTDPGYDFFPHSFEQLAPAR